MSKLLISQEQVKLAKKLLKYKKNPILFFEECCYLPIAGADRLVTLNEPQRKVVEDFYYNNVHDMIFLKSRQIGFSTLWQLISVHLIIFYSNVIVGLTSKQSSEASDFSKKCKDIIDKLPKEFGIEYKWNNTQSFAIANTNSEFYSSPVSIVMPAGLFRGKAIALLIMDEVAHIQKADEAWTGVSMSLSSCQQDAMINGIPYGTVLISTPNGIMGHGKFYHDMWVGAIEQTNSFKAYKIHWTEVKKFREDPNWYELQCKRFNNDPRKIQQELELQFVGNEHTFLAEDTIRKLQGSITEPTKKIRLKEGGELWCFKEKVDPKKFYLIGADVSSSYGKDFGAIQVMDFLSMEQVYEFKGKPTPKALADVIRMIDIFCPNNLIIIENQGGYGLGTIHELETDKQKDYNLFYEFRNQDSRQIRVPGLSTNPKTRPLIMQALYETVSDSPDLVFSERLKMELLSLAANKNDKVEAEGDSHDDLAMAYAFCCYIRKHYSKTLRIEEETGEDSDELRQTFDDIYELNGLSNMTRIESQADFDYMKKKIDDSWRKGEFIDRDDVMSSIYGDDLPFTFSI